MKQNIRLYEADGSLYDELMVEGLPSVITTEIGSIFVLNVASLGNEYVCYFQANAVPLNELHLASKVRMFGSREPTR